MCISEHDGINKLNCGGGGTILGRTNKCYMIVTWNSINVDFSVKPQNIEGFERK